MLEALHAHGGLLSGHFLLSSGRHSDAYLQVAAPFQYPEVAAGLAAGLAAAVRARGLRPRTVVGPALGAIVPGYELARALGTRFLFTERDAGGRMALRRGFAVEPGEAVLVCENVLTTGGSVMEVVRLLRGLGAEVVGVATYCDRMADPAAAFAGLPQVALARVELRTWAPEDCPLCRAGGTPEKPGSRPAAAGARATGPCGGRPEGGDALGHGR